MSRITYVALGSLLAVFSFKAISFLIVLVQALHRDNEILFCLTVLCIMFVGLWLYIIVRAVHEDKIERMARLEQTHMLPELPRHRDRITNG